MGSEILDNHHESSRKMDSFVQEPIFLGMLVLLSSWIARLMGFCTDKEMLQK